MSKKPEVNGHHHLNTFSDFILGSQDGLVNVLGIILGIILGMSAATRDVRLILVVTLAALGLLVRFLATGIGWPIFNPGRR
jgi:hypothetical protein